MTIDITIDDKWIDIMDELLMILMAEKGKDFGELGRQRIINTHAAFAIAREKYYKDAGICRWRKE